MIGDVYEVFELLEFQTILQSFDTVDEAVRSFKGASADGAAKSVDSGGEDKSSNNGGTRVGSTHGQKAE
jgi:hypothetical protein